MSEKQNSQSFLDKFKGRANRINKDGINKALDGESPLEIFLPTPKKAHRKVLNTSEQLHKSDLMDPEAKPSIRKRMNLKPLPMPDYRFEQRHESKNNNLQDSLASSKSPLKKG